MATKLRNLRVGDAEWAVWETAARDQGVTVSEFVRDAVAAAVAGKGAPRRGVGRDPTPPRSKSAGTTRSGRGTVAACERERFHRPGTFCKSCGKTT